MPSLQDYAPNLILKPATIDLDDDARTQGMNNLPASSDTKLNTAQQIIVDHFARENDKLNELAAQDVTRHFAEIHSIGVEQRPVDVSALLSDAKLEIQKQKLQAEGKLKPLCLADRRANRALRAFRHKHRLDYDARYPASTIYHFAIVAIVVLAESLANMYFFAQGSDLGLLGGLLQSFLVSVTNVGAALIVGAFALPQANHIRWPRRLVGFSAAAVLAVFVPCFNLLTAHYRDLLAADPETALTQTIPATLADPFGLSFDSLMLFVIGILAASLGLYKGYTADDRYPGYGRQSRECAATKEKYEAKIKEILDGLIGVIEDMKQRASQVTAKSLARIESLNGTINVLNQSFERYDVTRLAIEKECARHLKRYREVNQEIRDEPRPAYFAEFPMFPMSPVVQTARTDRIKEAEQLRERVKDEHAKLLERVAKLNDGLAQRIEQTAKELDETLEGIARAALLEIAEETESAKES